ncbi:hypothetical protein HanRHA438_Chr12g0536921 [Helianthus annuus]|nr:hypothetical protein HanRHA438_Chr12g0536921 [Helianthus annuus]
MARGDRPWLVAVTVLAGGCDGGCGGGLNCLYGGWQISRWVETWLEGGGETMTVVTLGKT